MESNAVDNTANQQIELDESMLQYLNQVKEIINNKIESFKEKLDGAKSELEASFKNQLVDVTKMNSDVKNMQDNLKNEGEEKNKIIEKTKTLKIQVESLITKMEAIELFANSIKEKPLGEILKIQGDNFIVNINNKEGSSDPSVGESPANTFKPLSCKSCRSLLVWNQKYLTNKCNFSQNCNNNYIYGCDNCDTSYCTVCASPLNKDICGCGKNMVYLSVPFHSCDLCTKSIHNSKCWRCTTCDFDICDTCYGNNGNSKLQRQNSRGSIYSQGYDDRPEEPAGECSIYSQDYDYRPEEPAGECSLYSQDYDDRPEEPAEDYSD